MQKDGLQVRHKQLLLFSVCVFLATTPVVNAAIMTLQSIGFLPGGPGTRPLAISSDGTTVVGVAGNASGVATGFRWTANTGMTALLPLGGDLASHARDVSPDGSVAVGVSLQTNANRGVRWSSTGDVQLVQTGNGTPLLEVTGVSAYGGAVVGRTAQDGFMINASGTHVIPGLSQFQDTYPWDISNDGTTVVGVSYTSTGAARAVRWTETGGLENLGTFGAYPGSCATLISADKSTITGWVDRGNGDLHTFRWTATDGMQKLNALPGYQGFTPGGISHDGSIIVGNSSAFGGNRAFIWTQALGFQDLNTVFAPVLPPNWTLIDAMISDDGQVLTGMASFGGQTTLGWIGTIPEPASGTFLLITLAMCLAKRRRAFIEDKND